MPAQIEVRGVDGELKSVAEGTLSLKPNFAYTLKEVRVVAPSETVLRQFLPSLIIANNAQRDPRQLLVRSPGKTAQPGPHSLPPRPLLLDMTRIPSTNTVAAGMCR